MFRILIISLSTMQTWLLQANICFSLLILLAGSQQDKFSWAPTITFGMLLSWGLTGTPLVYFHNRRLIQNRPWILLYPLQIWLSFMVALQTTLAEAILFLPLSTTAAMLYVATRQNQPRFEVSRLPEPIPGPNRGRIRRLLR